MPISFPFHSTSLYLFLLWGVYFKLYSAVVSDLITVMEQTEIESESGQSSRVSAFVGSSGIPSTGKRENISTGIVRC